MAAGVGLGVGVGVFVGFGVGVGDGSVSAVVSNVFMSLPSRIPSVALFPAKLHPVNEARITVEVKAAAMTDLTVLLILLCIISILRHLCRNLSYFPICLPYIIQKYIKQNGNSNALYGTKLGKAGQQPGLSIVFKHHSPFRIRSEHLTAVRFKAFKRRGSRMAVEVICTDGDHCDLRGTCLNKSVR